MKMTRRTAIAGLVAAGVWSAGAPALALEADEARAFVERASERLLALVRGAGSEASKEAAFIQLMNDVAAMPQIASYVVGAPWRRMSDGQKSEFQGLFERYLAKTYVRRFGDYSGEALNVVRVVDRGRKGVLVLTEVRRPGGEPIKVDWRVTDRTGAVKVLDLFVEGVSLVITQRDEFSGMFDRNGGDVDRFLADLRARLASA